MALRRRGQGAGRAIALLVLGLACLALAQCAPSLDAEQARLCRMLLPALVSEAEGIRVVTSESSRSKRTVYIGFEAGRPPAGQQLLGQQLLSCHFGGAGYSAAKRDLVAVTLNGRGLGESQLWFLKARWLESRHAVVADPGPPVARGAWGLDRGFAVALQHAIGGLPRIGILALLALATALIYGLIGRINLAFGEFAAMGGILATLALLIFGDAGMASMPVLAGVTLVIVVSTGWLAGSVVGQTVLVPLAGGRGLPILVAGVGMMIGVQEALRLAQGSGTLWLPPVGGEPIVLAEASGFTVTAHPRLLAMLGVDAVAILGTLWLMARSRFGREWQAVADDPLAAELLAIDPAKVLVLTSALATALAALAGATISFNYGGMNFAGGTMLGLTALIAAILGGIGSLYGALAGAVAIGVVQVLWQALHGIRHWDLASFTLLTLALVLRPGGFFGYADGAQRKA